MGTGIIVCGSNGNGKSTLGKVLAKKLLPVFSICRIIDVPKDIRIWRVRNRSFQKFGAVFKMSCSTN